MNTTTTNANQPASNTTDWSGWLKSSYDWFFVCGLVALLPLLLIHTQHLWAKLHFQFFPLAWGAFAALIYTRGIPSTTTSPARFWSGIACGALCMIATLFAVIMYSPWLAHIALIFLCTAWMLVRLGTTAWYLPLAWISLLLVTLPMPLNLDTRLVQRLQTWSTDSASSLMDVAGIPHLASGNVIGVRTGKLFVDEACSGVDSFYALAAVALLLTIWQGSSFLAGAITVALVPCWALMGNIFRIFTIAFLLDHFQIDLTHGWPHTVLGLCMFALAFICLSYTLGMLTDLFSPFLVRVGSVHKFFNRVVCWPGRDPASKKKVQTPGSHASKAIELGDRSTKLAGGAMLCVGLASLLPIFGIGPWNAPENNLPTLATETVAEHIASDALPAQIGQMQQIGFAIEHRDAGSNFGEHSATWRYADGERTVIISLDFPFFSYHNLDGCYVLSGQHLDSFTEVELPSGRIAYEARFLDQFREPSYLCYTEFTQGGTVVTIPTGLRKGIFGEGSVPTVFQVQIYVEGSGDVTEPRKEMYRKNLSEATERLLPLVADLYR